MQLRPTTSAPPSSRRRNASPSDQPSRVTGCWCIPSVMTAGKPASLIARSAARASSACENVSPMTKSTPASTAQPTCSSNIARRALRVVRSRAEKGDGDEQARLQVATPVELEEIALGADHRALLEPCAQTAVVEGNRCHREPRLSRGQRGADKVADRFEVRRQSSALRREGNTLANELESAPGTDAESRRIPKLNRLGCDDQLDRDDSLAQLHHLGEPAGGERGERHPIFDPLRLGGAGKLERDRL